MEKEKKDFMQPIKDIPRAFKGFPKNLKHIFKDPLTSSAEVAERRREILPFLYLSVGLFAIFVILCAVIPGDAVVFLSIFAVLFGFVALAFLLPLSLLKKAKRKFSDVECNKCHTRIAFGSNVKVVFLDKLFNVTKYNGANSQNANGGTVRVSVSGAELVELAFECKCQACGDEKVFNRKFTTLKCSKAMNVPYSMADIKLAEFEKDVREDYDEGFDDVPEIDLERDKLKKQVGNSPVTTKRGVTVNYKRTPGSLAAGYFGDEMR